MFRLLGRAPPPMDPRELIGPETDLDSLCTRIVAAPQGAKPVLQPGERYFPRRHGDLREHMRELRIELVGEPELCVVHAGVISLIRRQEQLDHFVPQFLRMWEHEGARTTLLRHLTLRWLVSAADTFVDHHPDPEARAVAMNGVLLANVLKLVESERLVHGLRGKVQPIVRPSRGFLFDGMTAFALSRGDMIDNMLDRLHGVTARQPVVGAIVEEMLVRVKREDTVFKRIERLSARLRKRRRAGRAEVPVAEVRMAEAPVAEPAKASRPAAPDTARQPARQQARRARRRALAAAAAGSETPTPTPTLAPRAAPSPRLVVATPQGQDAPAGRFSFDAPKPARTEAPPKRAGRPERKRLREVVDAPKADPAQLSQQLIGYYADVHRTEADYGRSSERLLAQLQRLLVDRSFQPKTILDFGCGKSRLVDWIAKLQDSEALRYDPAIPAFATKPAVQADLVLNTDVLEHIPESGIDTILRDIRSSGRHAFFVVYTARSRHTLPNGLNMHVTIKPAAWWKDRIGAYFPALQETGSVRENSCTFFTW